MCLQHALSLHSCKSWPQTHAQAMRRNPFAPMVPCHRVIAADLQLGGFSGSWVSDATTATAAS